MISVGIMLWILLVFFIIALIVGFTFGMRTMTDSFKKSGSTVFDAKQDYMQVVNSFIRRESAFELFKWVNSSVTTKNANGTSVFAEKMKDAAAISKQVTIMTTVIFTRMSTPVKNAFYRMYGKDLDTEDEDNAIYEYITRWLMFAIRRVTFDLSVFLQERQEVNFDDIVKTYLIQLETEIYKNNDIYLLNVSIDDDSSSGSTSPTAK